MRRWKVLSVAAVVVLAAAAPSAHQGGVTVEIAIGKSIENHMAVDTGSAFPATVGSLICWTSVTGASGQKISHVWTHGPHSATVELNVGGSPWRTYSRRTIPAEWTGEWTVQVKDSAGTVLATKTFTVN
jgi:hypothetical protein